jgi:geranylgeranyl diphosphate synthase type I
VLGVFGDPDQTGKPAGDDLREGKRTILIAFAVEQASAAQAETLERLLGDHALDRAGVDALRALIDDTGALDRVERLISELVERSTAALADAEVGPEARDALTALITAATSRSV